MRNSKLTTFTDSYIILVSFIIFLFSMLEMKDTVFLKQKIFKKIFQNIELNPIESITTNRNFCEEDGLETFFNYTFQGIKGGSFDLKSNNMSDHYCEDEHSFRNCRNIPQIKSKYMNVLKDKALCLKRMDKSKYNVVSQNDTCKEGYRKCGYYNEYKDILCTNNTTPCPINYINITLQTDVNFTDPAYRYDKLQPDLVLVSSNNITENIVPIDFALSEDIPCIEYERISYNQKYPYHPRTNNKNLFGCNSTNITMDYSFPHLIGEGLDRRYDPLLSVGKKYFYFDNDVFNKYASLPNMKNWTNDIHDANFTFYVRNYISVNYTCSSVDDFEKFTESLNNFKKLKFFQMVVAFLNIIILCVSISFLSLVKMIKRIWHSVLSILKIVLNFAYISFNFYLSFESFEHTNNIRDYIRGLLDSECLDMYTYMGIVRYDVKTNIDGINKINNLMYYATASYGFMLIIQFIRQIYKVFVRIKNTKRRREGKEVRALLIARE